MSEDTFVSIRARTRVKELCTPAPALSFGLGLFTALFVHSVLVDLIVGRIAVSVRTFITFLTISETVEKPTWNLVGSLSLPWSACSGPPTLPFLFSFTFSCTFALCKRRWLMCQSLAVAGLL